MSKHKKKSRKNSHGNSRPSPHPAMDGPNKLAAPYNPLMRERMAIAVQRQFGERPVDPTDESATAAIFDSMRQPYEEAAEGRLSPIAMANLKVEISYALPEQDRIRGLLRALAHSWECAEAYLALGHEILSTPEDALRFFERAVILADAHLPDGPVAFLESQELRTAVRAHIAVARASSATGELNGAIDHLNTALELDADDHNDARQLLARVYAETGRYAEANEVLTMSDDGLIWEVYCRPLFLCGTGDHDAAVEALRDALGFNPFVPEYLLGRRRIPKRLTGLSAMKGPDAAAAYVLDWQEVWRATPGAMELFGDARLK